MAASPTLAQKNIGRYQDKPTLEEAEEREAEVKRRIARKQRRANYGKARASSMALIDQAQATNLAPGWDEKAGKWRGLEGKAWDPDKQQYVDIEPKEKSGPTSVLPDEKGKPASLVAPPPPKETAEQARIRKAQEDLLGKEAAAKLIEEKRKEEERRQSFIGLGERILESGRESGSNVSGWLARIPTPGSLWFPLVLLLIFFFILVMFNGHTRLQWAWLVLSGNASFNLGGQGQTTEVNNKPSGGGVFGQPQALTLAPQPSTPPSSLSPSGMPMTGGNPF